MGPDGSRRLRPVREQDEEVMAAIDQSGKVPTLIVADITADEAWLSMPAAEAPVLQEWQ